MRCWPRQSVSFGHSESEVYPVAKPLSWKHLEKRALSGSSTTLDREFASQRTLFRQVRKGLRTIFRLLQGQSDCLPNSKNEVYPVSRPSKNRSLPRKSRLDHRSMPISGSKRGLSGSPAILSLPPERAKNEVYPDFDPKKPPADPDKARFRGSWLSCNSLRSPKPGEISFLIWGPGPQ